MSNARPPSRPRPGGALVLVAALLIPVCLVSWLLWQAASGKDDGAGEAPHDSATPAERGERSEPPDVTSSSEPSGDRSDRFGSPDGRTLPLTGTVVVIDPGHNPGNQHHSPEISRSVDIGGDSKECDTTGTTTNAGYPEAEFTLDVAHRVRAMLEKRGATVKLTQDRDRAFGPCVTERARFGNEANADAVVSVHADGAGTGDRGFHVIAPRAVHRGGADNRSVVRPSYRLGRELATAFARRTGSSPANYLEHHDGVVTRDDLGGLNLTRVPKVFLECGNMRDRADAERLTDARWRGRAALGIADGITAFLTGKR